MIPEEQQVPAPDNRRQPRRHRPRGRGPRGHIAPPKNPENVSFLCDVMLGKLARELRLLGYDAAYDRTLGGMPAYRIARQSGRILLTRTSKLKGLPGTIYIPGQLAPEQVAQVKAEMEAGLKPAVPVEVEETPVPVAKPPVPRPQPQSAPASPPAEKIAAYGRCLQCNVPLEKLTREQARPSVPFFIYQIHHDFRGCPKCRKIYWPGNHVEQMAQRAGPPPRARRPFRGGPRRQQNTGETK
ncbi:MAG TPA: Mut7-C RNAse domain-containing protein [bacterium]|nr:Mut7-C RNAse domain-containing protein [bacterium]